MGYYHHPLLDLAENASKAAPPTADATPADFGLHFQRSTKQKIKLQIGNILYPLKNLLERRSLESSLIEAGVPRSLFARVNLMTKGDRGFGNQLNLKAIARRVGKVDTVSCFGCGIGDEMLDVARFLRPRKIIGYEYFNYERAWEHATDLLAQQGVEAEFLQCDLRNPPPASIEKADILLSFAVLEHLHSIPGIFSNLTLLLKDSGWFTSIWGPLWYTFSGDHIAGELGFEHGYDHVQLSPSEYVRWHAVHPRNIDSIKRGEPTWLEMGLISYAQYAEYIEEIERHFGQIKWFAWAVSEEGLAWRRAYPKKWNQMLLNNSHIQPLDLLLKSAAVLTRVTPHSAPHQNAKSRPDGQVWRPANQY
jgi:SAM-dependent methyltransferase